MARISKKTTNKKTVSKKPKSPSTGKARYILSIMFLLAVVLYLASKDLKPDKDLPTKTKQDQTNRNENRGKELKKELKSFKNNENIDSNKEIAIKLYFVKTDSNGNIKYEFLTTTVMNNEKYISSIKKLIEGPSLTFKDKGFQSAIPEKMKINSMRIKNGIAIIDVNSDFKINSVGDFLVARLNQLYLTLTQFPEIKGIIVTIDGQKSDTPGNDGRVIKWPMTGKL